MTILTTIQKLQARLRIDSHLATIWTEYFWFINICMSSTSRVSLISEWMFPIIQAHSQTFRTRDNLKDSLASSTLTILIVHIAIGPSHSQLRANKLSHCLNVSTNSRSRHRNGPLTQSCEQYWHTMTLNDRKFIWLNNFPTIGMIKRGVGANCYFVHASGTDILT